IMAIISAPPPIPATKFFSMTESWATRRFISARTWWKQAGRLLILLSMCGKRWRRAIFQTTLPDHGGLQKPLTSLPATAAHGERSRFSGFVIYGFLRQWV